MEHTLCFLTVVGKLTSMFYGSFCRWVLVLEIVARRWCIKYLCFHSSFWPIKNSPPPNLCIHSHSTSYICPPKNVFCGVCSFSASTYNTHSNFFNQTFFAWRQVAPRVFELLGLVSWGDNCRATERPTVFSNVPREFKWGPFLFSILIISNIIVRLPRLDCERGRSSLLS